jgi:hypothetical protein
MAMAMVITMRIAAQIFFPATEVTQGPLSCDYYTHKKRTPELWCASCAGVEETTTTKMSERAK